MRFLAEAIFENGFLADSKKDSSANFRCYRKTGLRAWIEPWLYSVRRRSGNRANEKHSDRRECWVRSIGSAYYRNARRAFTILEMLIVLVVLVSLLAIAWPQINRQIQRSDLKQVALTLKEEISNARSAAIESGQTWKLQFGEFSSRYECGPVSTFHGQQSELPTIQIGRQESGNELENPVALKSIIELDPDVFLSTIPKEKLVSEETDRIQTEPETIEIGNSNEENREGKKQKEILFFPDGRASETTLIIIDSRARTGIEIKVRGLTGQVEIGSFLKIETEFKRADTDLPEEVDDDNLDLEFEG